MGFFKNWVHNKFSKCSKSPTQIWLLLRGFEPHLVHVVGYFFGKTDVFQKSFWNNSSSMPGSPEFKAQVLADLTWRVADVKHIGGTPT